MKWITRVRSAITGRFVHKEEAQRNPDTTVTERVKVPDSKPRWRKRIFPWP